MKELTIFDNPKNVKLFRIVFFLGCVVLLFSDLLIHKHGYFSWEEWPAFHAAFGFVACVILVLVSKFILRPLVMRKEDYYGDDE